MRGSAPRTIAAFNFDLVYDQSLVRMEALEANLPALLATGRQFSCDLPAPSVDIEPAPAVGRARLACFSFGDLDAPGFSPPFVLATVTLRAVAAGSAQLVLQNAGVYSAEGTSLGTVETAPATLTVR